MPGPALRDRALASSIRGIAWCRCRGTGARWRCTTRWLTVCPRDLDGPRVNRPLSDDARRNAWTSAEARAFLAVA